MNRVRTLVVVTALGIAAAAPAHTQEMPNCSVKIVVSGPAGGTPDLIARLGADKLSAGLDKPVIVENRAGGLGAITSVEYVKASEPNGCTLMAANASLFSILPTLYKKPPFDAAKDFVPVSVVARSPNALVIDSKLPATNWKEFLALLKANPGKYLMGSGGVGTPMHLYGSMLKATFDLDITHVPYRGSAATIIGLLGGQVHFTFEQIPSFLGHAKAGKLRPIAVAADTRSDLIPDVPTFKELGVDGLDAIAWFGLVAPRGTPKNVTSAYAKILIEGVRDPKVVARMRSAGAQTYGTTPDEMAAFMAGQLSKWAPMVKASSVMVD